MAWLSKLKEGLVKTSMRFKEVFSSSILDKKAYESLEEALILSDVGVQTAHQLVQEVQSQNPACMKDAADALSRRIESLMKEAEEPFFVDLNHKPFVLLMSGVNGAGKTTTIAKLAQKFKKQGLSVLLVAADTFRSAGIEQLQEWGDKIGIPVFSKPLGSDPAGVVFDAVIKAQTMKADVVLVDTSGRLPNKKELMAELEKINRVIKKIDETAPHASLLVLDASVGQNTLTQVEAFSNCLPITGVVMTKLDGSAKGGVLIALTQKFHLPVCYLGVGEKEEDLQMFKADEYAQSLLGLLRE
jgi:fused signal recognition particle receptor